MARQAEAHGQLGLALHLFALAAWLDGRADGGFGLPGELDLNRPEDGHAVLTRETAKRSVKKKGESD